MKLLFEVAAFLLVINLSINAFTNDEWKNIQNAETLSVYIDNQPAGQMQTSLTVSDSFVSVETEMKTDMSGGVSSQIVATIVEKRDYDLDGKFIRASQVMSSPAGENSWSLGKTGDKWFLKVTAAGVENSRQIDMANERIANLYELYQGIQNSTIKAGKVWNDTMMELTSGQPVYVKTTCVETPSQKNDYTWKFTEVNSVNQKDEIWIVDKNGKTVYKEVLPFVAKRKDTGQKDTTAVNIFEKFMIPASKAARENEDILISADNTFSLDKSVEPFYVKSGSKYKFRKPANSCNKKTAFLYPDSLKTYLLATPTMQIDNGDIKKLADQFNKSSDICGQIAEMNDYVFTSIKKEYTATFSSALETYKAGFGDCGEHAVLLAAMLRASGVPARVVFGVVYMPSRKGYYYHAWVMAFDGAGWVFADPALGVFPANRDRLPLLVDDNGEKMLSLARIIGKLKIEYGKKP